MNRKWHGLDGIKKGGTRGDGMGACCWGRTHRWGHGGTSRRLWVCILARDGC